MSPGEWLDLLIEHEVAYMGMAAGCARTEHAVFLHAPTLPEYHDANRAIRLRTNGASAELVARQVVEYYRSRGLQPVADLDPVAEAEGIGEALRQQGMAQVEGDRLLMRYSAQGAPDMSATRLMPPSDIPVFSVPNERGNGEAADWIDTVVADDVGWPDERLWRAVADLEARYSPCRLFLARLNGRPVGVCDLFVYAGWARLDSVVTRPEFRRRGVGAALVTHAINASLTSGCAQTYLFTEPGGAAERLYRRLGFLPWQMNVFRQYRGPIR